ncbi:MAG: hypothetical protein FWF36_00370 [Propionibacteriaceae bacterium]|nr:hypothetical protein [Propionibacteriaceae bacterium]
MADSNDKPGTTHRVPVQVIFWHPELGMRPEVIADRDGDRADYRAATRIWETMTRDGGGNTEWAQFLANHPSPSRWRELQDVVHWLEAVNMEVSRPQTLYDTPVLRDDARPGQDRDLTVGVISFSDDLIGNTAMFAGFDQADVERRVAQQLLSYIDDGQRDLGQGEGFRPDLDDPAQVTRWLDRASTELTQIGFSIHQTVLHADPALADLDAVGPDAPAASAPSIAPVEAAVWLGAVFWDPRGALEPDEYLAASSREQLEHDLASLLYRELADNQQDRRFRDFVEDHTRPRDWATPGDVSNYLDAFYAESPGPAFNYQQVDLTIPAGQKPEMAHVACLTETNPFDSRLIADTDLIGLHQQIVDHLASKLSAQPPLQGAEGFLAEHHHPGSDLGSMENWINDYQREIGYPVVGTDQVILPPDLTTTPPTDTSTPVAVQPSPVAAPVPPTQPPTPMTVRVDDLWAAVVESEDLREEDPQVWVGDYDTVAQAAVRILADAINPDDFSGHMAEQRAEFLATHPVDLDNYDSMERWLDAYRQQFNDPAVFVRQVYDPAKTQNLPPLPEGAEPPAAAPQVWVRLAETPEPVTAPQAMSTGEALLLGEEMVVGVIRWGDDPSEMETMVGGTRTQMEHDAAMRMWEDLQSPAFDAADVPNPTGLDAAGITAWLADVVGPDGKPVLTIHEHVPTPRLTQAMGEAINQAVLGIVEPATPQPPTPQPAPVTTPGTVTIETERAGDWEVLNDGGIPDRLIAAFPHLPRVEDHLDADGTVLGDRWGEAVEDWMEQCLDLANDAAHLPELRQRLERLESLRDRIASHLADHPLPREPRPGDYQIARPDYLGQIDDGQYREDRLRWEHDFRRTALDTEQTLTRLVGTTSPNQPAAGGAADPMVEAASRRVGMLYELITPGPGGSPSLAEKTLSAADRMRVYQTIRAGSAPIRVPNPDGEGDLLYSGYATTAYQHLPAGVYDATWVDDSGQLKLIVGRSPVSGCSGASGAYPLNQATINLLDDVPHLHDQAVQQAVRPDVTVTVGFTVNRASRLQTDFPMSPPVGGTPPGMSL